MSTLEKLKACQTRSDLSKLLGFVPKGLAFALYKIPDDAKYREFSIPKKGGGQRKICAPNPRLGLVQRRLATRLYECVLEIEEKQPNRRRVTHGFQKGRSIITNADRHHSRRYVFNIDIQDFFQSINFGRVRGFFQKDSTFALNDEVATTIAQIACWQNGLPQGSPCSPVIANLVGHILDVKLLKLAKQARCRYTRYADDISFSTSERNFPSLIAARADGKPAVWEPSENLASAIRQAGFAINPAKTRMQIRGSRQMATGLMVNEKVNIRPEYYNETRAMCHRLFTTGRYEIPRWPDRQETDQLGALEGRLSHIFAVKARLDLSSKRRKERHVKVPSGTIELCRRFLFYKNFVVNPLPVIITEGPSDVIYLRAALRARGKEFPKLYDARQEQKFLVRFVNHSHFMRENLLGHGVGGLGTLISRYHATLQEYAQEGQTAPVVLLVDNDEESDKAFKAAKKAIKEDGNGAASISVESNDAWHHLIDNLYLVKIPHGGAEQKKRVIEQLLPEEWLKHEVDGKRFDPSKKHGDHSSLGKVFFAKKVVEANADKINFGAFDALFSLLDGALRDFEDKRKQEAGGKVMAAS